MNKVIRALLATEAELHWHYDRECAQYVARIFKGQRTKEMTISEKAAAAPHTVGKFEDALVEAIYEMGVDDGAGT